MTSEDRDRAKALLRTIASVMWMVPAVKVGVLVDNKDPWVSVYLRGGIPALQWSWEGPQGLTEDEIFKAAVEAFRQEMVEKMDRIRAALDAYFGTATPGQSG